MSLWFDKNWINRLQVSLEGFQWSSDTTATFRCPICGDSRKNPNKRRGYFYVIKGHWSMKCHNCGAAHRLPTFIKIAFPHLYTEYKKERFEESRSLNLEAFQEKKSTEVPIKQVGWEDYSVCLQDLPQEHSSVEYVLSRKIPSKRLNHIYHTDNLDELVRIGFGITDRYYQNGASTIQSKPMIFFPITDDSGEIKGIQARSTSRKSFITLMFDRDFPKIYGLGDNDPNKPTFVFEAAFCQQLVPNQLALLGATAPQKLEEFVRKDKTIMVFDNEPRSNDTIKRMESAINAGYKVAFWPPDFKHKDLNDYIKDDETPDIKWLLKQLQNETYSGGRAKLKLQQWKKVR